jgi:hypothetical protein
MKTTLRHWAAAVAVILAASTALIATGATPAQAYPSCIASTPFSGSSGAVSVNGWYTNLSNGTVCVGTVESTVTAGPTGNYTMRVRVRQQGSNNLLYEAYTNPISGGPPSVSNGLHVRLAFPQTVYVCVAWSWIPNDWSTLACVNVP